MAVAGGYRVCGGGKTMEDDVSHMPDKIYAGRWPHGGRAWREHQGDQIRHLYYAAWVFDQERARAETAKASKEIAEALFRECRQMAARDRDEQKLLRARAKAAEAERDRLRLTPNDLYYLRAIDRRLRELADALEGINGLTIGGEALADERDWLDCFIARADLAKNEGGNE